MCVLFRRLCIAQGKSEINGGNERKRKNKIKKKKSKIRERIFTSRETRRDHHHHHHHHRVAAGIAAKDRFDTVHRRDLIAVNCYHLTCARLIIIRIISTWCLNESHPVARSFVTRARIQCVDGLTSRQYPSAEGCILITCLGSDACASLTRVSLSSVRNVSATDRLVLHPY